MPRMPCVTDTAAYAEATGPERGAYMNFEAHAASVAARAAVRKAAIALRDLGDHYTSSRAIELFTELAENVEAAEAEIEGYLRLADERQAEADAECFGDDSRYDRAGE